MGTTQSGERKLPTLESYPPRKQLNTSTRHDGSFWYHCKQNGEGSPSILYNPEQSWLRIVEGRLSAFSFNNTDVIALGEEEHGPDQYPTLFVLTYHRHREPIKIVNKSKHNIIINRTKGDPLIVPSGEAIKGEDLDETVQKESKDVVPLISHEVGEIIFHCVDDVSGGVIITVSDGPKW